MTQKLRYFCTLLLMAVVGVAWADEVVYKTALFGSDYNSKGVSSYTDTWTATNDGFVVTLANFNNNNNGWDYVKCGRKNNASVATITTGAVEEAITKVDVTIDAITAAKVNSIKLYISSDKSTWTEAGSYTKATGTQSVSLSSPAADLYYKIEFDCASGTSNGLVTVSKVEYYYDDTPASGDTPSITASNVDIAYDATDGEIVYTINNPVEGGSLTASCEEDWIFVEDAAKTDAEGTISFICDANTVNTDRTATVTLTYTYDNETVTKNVTVTQAAAPVIYTTIPDLFAAATSTETPVAITFNNWVISAVKDKNAYLTDNQGNGLIIYQNGHGFNVNDVLSGTASCKLVLYRGSAELTGLTATTTGLTVTPNGTVTEQNIAINELTGVNTGALVHYDGLTYNGTDLVDGNNNSIKPYNTLYEYTFEEGKTYNVTGIYLQFNTTKEILPRSADDIEEVIPTEPTVTVNPTAVDVDAAEHDGTITVSCENMGENLDISVFFCEESDVTTPAEYHWITADIDNNNNVYYIIEANTATEARTAYMVVKVADADTKEVYNSNLITFTQEGFSAIRNFTFEQTSATAGTLTNEPEGVTAVFNNTYTNNKEQLTKDNSMTLTIKGMPANYKVTGITLTVKNNASKGSGTATVSIGKKEIGTLDVTGLGSTYGDQDVTIIPSFATSDLVINIAATENSVYCKKFTIEYEIMDYVGVTIKEGFTATTFSCDKALDFSNVEGITANIITDENGLTKPVEKVPAGKGLYIVGAEGDYEVPFLANEAEAEDVSDNWLIPTDGTQIQSDEFVTYYAFGKQNGKEAFYKVPTSGYTPSANKAVLVVNAPASSAKEMIVIGGDVTGIESIENGTIVNDNYYTIDGKLVKGQPMQKGIYVVNGRKVVIK